MNTKSTVACHAVRGYQSSLQRAGPGDGPVARRCWSCCVHENHGPVPRCRVIMQGLATVLKAPCTGRVGCLTVIECLDCNLSSGASRPTERPTSWPQDKKPS